MIVDGQVKVHGAVEVNPKRMVNPDTAHIEISGKKVGKEKSVLLLFHKPKGVLTTKRDPEGRKTIYDVLGAEFSTFHAVGRLDQQTSGLLLLTNDTKLSSFLTDPQNEIPRTYLVTVRGEFTVEDISQALFGIKDCGEVLKAKKIELIKVNGKESTLTIILTEGKNREIRRLCLALTHEVTSLKRTKFGEYLLGDLKVGESKFVEILKAVPKIQQK